MIFAQSRSGVKLGGIIAPKPCEKDGDYHSSRGVIGIASLYCEAGNGAVWVFGVYA